MPRSKRNKTKQTNKQQKKKRKHHLFFFSFLSLCSFLLTTQMSAAIFELLGKLAAATTNNPTPSASGVVSAPLAPLQTSLPTVDECTLYGQEKPLLFFFDPQHGDTTTATAVAGVAAFPQPPSSTPSAWPAELSAVQLAAATTSVQTFCVTPAEDDVAMRMGPSEVWVDWPQTVCGWQLCPMSHLCAVMRCKATRASASSAPASGHANQPFYLLASRYELVGTTAVYERYLLLSPQKVNSKNSATAAATSPLDIAAGTTAISVHELRELHRVTCLCRCFCSGGCEVQQQQQQHQQQRVGGSGGGGGGGGQALPRKEAAPPLSPADYFLRLAPTSLQYTFCFTTAALLSVAEEQRCRGWAAATAKLSQAKACGGGREHRSCSTEAANTSGALSDGGHTCYPSSSFSRELSASAVRVVDGATMHGFCEDPRSAVSTPARPTAVSRLDEQQQQQPERNTRTSSDRRRGWELESRLPPSQRWCALSLLRLIDTAYYDEQVPAGWRRWRYASSGILCRPLVVDSLDGIVRYIHGSRLAFYTAVAFLDRFIAATVDPISNFQAYRRQIYRARTGQEMDFRLTMRSGVSRCASAVQPQQPPQPYDDDVHARDICGFLTQVIVVCIMLGSKTVDLYPPRIRQLMGCVEDTAPISEQEFVILELHVLLTLGFPVHPVTLFESINALLTFSTSDELFATLTASHTTRRLLEEYQDRGHLVDDVDKLLMEQTEQDAASAVRGCNGSGSTSQKCPTYHSSCCSTNNGFSARGTNNGGGRPTESLTHADRQAMNDWLRLRLFAYFICDEVIRADAAGSASASSSNQTSRRSTPRMTRACSGAGGAAADADRDEAAAVDEEEEEEEWSDGFNVLRYSPVLVATAALATAAEQLGLPLPHPLLRLLPPARQERLRGDDGLTSDVLRMRLHSDNNERSNSAGGVAHPSHRHPHLASPPCTAGAAATMTPETPLRLTAQPADDHYKVLEELSLLLEAELTRLHVAHGSESASHVGLLSPPRDTAAEAEEDKTTAATGAAAARLTSSWSPASAHRSRARRGISSDESAAVTVSVLPPADPDAVALLEQVICQVQNIHERSRESCPPVLLQRYQPLFRETL